MAQQTEWVKDPNAVLDWVFDWSQWLALGETISSISVFATAGLTINSSTHTTTQATAWISGGNVGRLYQLTARITTSAGRTDDRSISIRVRTR